MILSLFRLNSCSNIFFFLSSDASSDALGLNREKKFLRLLLILFIAIDALNVQARLYQQAQGQKQKEHLERWEVGHLHTSEIVANHVTWTQYQVADAAEHTPIAQTPDIQMKQDCILERIAAYLADSPQRGQ